MEDVTEHHDAEAGVGQTALRELDPNAIASSSDPHLSKDQTRGPTDTGEVIVDANGAAVYDDLDNAAKDEGDQDQPVLRAGQVPRRKKKKQKPKSQRGLVWFKSLSNLYPYAHDVQYRGHQLGLKNITLMCQSLPRSSKRRETCIMSKRCEAQDLTYG